MEMGLDYLIDESLSSESDGRSDLEYQERVKRSTKPSKNPTAWTICQELCDMSCFSLLMGGRQLTGNWKVSQHDRAFISKFGYLFEDYRGPPVLYRQTPQYHKLLDPVFTGSRPMRLWTAKWTAASLFLSACVPCSACVPGVFPGRVFKSQASHSTGITSKSGHASCS